MAKLRVAVLFGGTSSEHEISCISAASVVDNIPMDSYDITKIGITKKGRWLLFPGDTDKMRDGSWERSRDCVPAVLSPDRLTHGLLVRHGEIIDVLKIDIVFPALHGRGGEDGTVQGLLELAGIPYVGCGLLSSALCIDKAIANQLFDAHGIPHTPWHAIHRRELSNFDALLPQIAQKLKFPIFVKPAGGGSSVGVTKANNEKELHEAAMLAATHDKKIVFEQGVVGQEVECSVIGNSDTFTTLPGEILSCNEIYDYEAKYKSGGASKTIIPANLPQGKLEEVRALAEKAYEALECEGLARVDFFVEQGTGRVLLNEINTLPGFTPISMYSQLLAAEGLSFPQVVDRLIQLGLERAEK